MSHAKNKVEWCLKKSERELKESGKHRGLAKVKPDKSKARDHIKKAEHYFSATEYLNRGNFSDISSSTVFYAMYHCLLAIATNFRYESRNQECTFALIYSLIEENKIDLEKEIIYKIAALNTEDISEKTIIEIREQYQYGTELSIKDDLYQEILELARVIITRAKIIIEK